MSFKHSERIFNTICHVYNEQLTVERGTQELKTLTQGGERFLKEVLLSFQHTNDPIDAFKIIKNKYG